MFEKLDNCPLCQSGHFTNHIICKDFSVSHEQFALVKCDACGFLFTNPRPSADSLDKYYQSEDYVSHKNKSTNPVNLLYKLARKYTLRKKLHLIQSYEQPGRILDIGCGTGHFLGLTFKNGWHSVGVEPDSYARSHINQNLKVYDTIHDINELPFNVITMWHVLEHIPDINALLKKLYELLHKKGTAFIAVPNYKSFDAQTYKQFWAAYDVPRHLYHFEKKTFKALMKKHGLKVVAIKPMKLDAYYVSLLSEKYKNNGVNNYINSFLNGYQSNSYAKNHDDNYSSLIYTIRKK